MADQRQKSESISKEKPAAYEKTTDPHKQLLDALSGFNGWKLPPLNHRADISDGK